MRRGVLDLSELRRDPITNRWVVIAAERGKRPQTVDNEADVRGEEAICPFCPAVRI